MKTNKQEIQEELLENGAFLNNASKKMPFEVPNNYFQENELEINSIIKLKNSSSDEMPFSVPTNYFNTLPEIINAQTITSKPKAFTWHWNMSSMAASLIFALIVYSFFTYKNEPNSAIALSSLPTEDIQQYLLQTDVSLVDLDKHKSNVSIEDINDEIISEFLNELH